MPARRAHIAMIGVPVVSHVLPGIEVVRELVARGHRVTYANAPSMADLVTPTGAELVAVDSRLPVADGGWPSDPVAAMSLFLDENVRMLPRLRAVYDEDPADVYLYDIAAYAARALAEAQGRALMQLSPTYVAWRGWAEEVAARVRQLPGADAYLARFADWLSGNGAVTRDVDAFTARPAHTLALIPEAMQPNADRVDTSTVAFTGSCFGDRSGQGVWQRPDTAEHVLLISLGSAFTRQPAFYRRCLAAFGDLPGWHVVLQIGRRTDPAELGAIPGNVEVHSWVPQLSVLEQADAFVTHAGMGGSSEGLYTGVPMIAVPQAVDQFGNADRLVELGVARRLDTEQATARALREALLELTCDPQVAERCARLRDRCRAEGGTARAADLVEAMLG
ncbi:MULTISPECIES: macrolide family glycosyltransferase [Streptomycetaceae]|uniref:Glycosyltransferase, MGT family n=1 Tax=Streptantibioticus cattleyicolor (strain ATCC 35852 / DSM 46488 / JCM 4925 / NBRC 14057 / NRRL 8057) TaxID=1003195 RepID=F8JQI6_STREN|nr:MULTISPECIES: macrolide family glycosyltransferase [Streptomycetaceae]AEW97830.1 glycosyltransferase, MGT family [Streptantibioticus cattleyicolor NRRL 8057 = DSM 46488]MYS62245.1 glycosyl transferase [Streptomyces sp. SID5468]CCB78148.1 Oleandomycin glycosyltransferase [Streptantibioticus cattleyicolor NRRL 8057 = DSM 46488]